MSDFDALADLFLNTGTASKPSPTRRSTTHVTSAVAHSSDRDRAHAVPAIEAIVMGSLPVLGVAWLAPYAKHVADTTREPVAVIRLDGDRTQVDLIAPSGWSRAPIMPCATLDHALQTAARICGRVLVRAEQTMEESLARLRGVSRITLLTGADEAAIVSCYSVMKALDARASEDASEDDEQSATESRASFTIAVLGAPSDRSAMAEQSLRRAASAFLKREISEVSHIHRIGSTALTNLYRGPGGQTPQDILDALRETDTEPTVLRLADDEPRTINQPRPPQPSELIEPKRILMQQDDHSTVIPQAAPRTQPHHPEQPRSDDAWTVALLPVGLSPISTSCPYAAGVRLCTDSTHALHLTIAVSRNAPVPDPVGRLLVAASWAHDHADLLARAHPDSLAGWSAQRDPTLHVMADDPSLIRTLLATGVRVHAVSGAGETWTCFALNEPST